MPLQPLLKKTFQLYSPTEGVGKLNSLPPYQGAQARCNIIDVKCHRVGQVTLPIGGANTSTKGTSL